MEPYVGEIRLFAGYYAPNGWALCNGQSLAISDNQILYSLIGTTYGGDGVRTFNLPNLQARLALGAGNGPGLTPYPLGGVAGAYQVTLTQDQLPTHTHTARTAAAAATSTSPTSNLFAAMVSPNAAYVPCQNPNVKTMTANPSMIQATGGGQAHDNTMPSLGLSYIIALAGVYPQFD